MLKKIIYLLLLIFFQHQSFCHNGKVVIKGYIPDCNSGETIQLRIFKYYFQRRWNEDGLLTTATIENGKFSFVIPANESRYVSIFLPDKYSKKNLVLYLVEPGDNIVMNISLQEILFFGKGAAKYTFQYKTSILPGISWTPEELRKMEGKKGYDYLVRCKEKYDSLFECKLQILNEYKGKITSSAFKRIFTDNEAERLFTLYKSFDFWFYYPVSPQERQQQVAFYKSHYSNVRHSIRDDGSLIMSKFYSDWLIHKIKLDLLVKNYPKPYTLVLMDVVSLIKKNFTGLLKEKLLITALLHFPPVEKSGIVSLKEIEPMITEPYFKNLFHHCKEKIPGALAYSFTLIDEMGKAIKLGTFKNKVVVMDFWITGCVFSKDAKEGLKKIKETFAGDTSFVFISVSAEKKRSKWLEGLQDSSYNIKGDINLYTGGLGSDHTLLKKYDYQSYPKILIIDKNQKVFSVMPPRPGTAEHNRLFTLLLKEASR